jgi:hypothetical protein
MDIPAEQFLLLSFMLNYDIVGQNPISTIDSLLDLIKNTELKIGPDLLICKFFEYTTWLNINANEAYEIFKNNFDKDDSKQTSVKPIDSTKSTESEPVDQFNTFIQLTEAEQIIFKPFNKTEARIKIDYLLRNNLFKLNKPNTSSKKEQNVPHNGLPLPDPELGRPKLNWRQCYFKNCGKNFSTPSALVQHLTECNAYTEGYHWAHEEALYCIVGPDNVRNKKLTKCPAYACNHKSFNTPEELIHHWELLGIEPFWQKGMCFLSDNTANSELTQRKKLLYSIPKLFVTDTCMICLENPTEIVLDKCRHHVYCIDCLKTCSKDSCPVCRSRIDNFIPFA